MLKKTWIIIFLVLLAVSLSACSSKPSASDAEKLLQNHLDDMHKDRPGAPKIVSFKKTNGQEQNVYGQEIYTMYFEAEIEYTADGGYPFGLDFFNSTDWGNLRGPIKKGHRVKGKGVLSFSKTEKGWRGGDGKIY